jgi:hypothetical protein
LQEANRADQQRREAEKSGNILPDRGEDDGLLGRYREVSVGLAATGNRPSDVGGFIDEPAEGGREPRWRISTVGIETHAARVPDAAVSLGILDALTRRLRAGRYRLPVGKPRPQIDVGIDAKQLHLQLPGDDVGESLVCVANLAIGPDEGDRGGDDKAEERHGYDPQRQRPFQVEGGGRGGFASRGAF